MKDYWKIYLAILQYYRTQEVKLEEDAKAMAENFQRDIEKQEALQKKLELMRDHPEWFETTSPKEYGMKLLKRKRR